MRASRPPEKTDEDQQRDDQGVGRQNAQGPVEWQQRLERLRQPLQQLHRLRAQPHEDGQRRHEHQAADERRLHEGVRAPKPAPNCVRCRHGPAPGKSGAGRAQTVSAALRFDLSPRSRCATVVALQWKWTRAPSLAGCLSGSSAPPPCARRAPALRAPDDPREAAARQARLVLEVARRTAEPAEALPPGAQPAVVLALYRDAIYWALAARRAGPRPTARRPARAVGRVESAAGGRVAAGQRRIGRAPADAVRRLRAARAGGQRRGRRARARLRRGARVGHGRPRGAASRRLSSSAGCASGWLRRSRWPCDRRARMDAGTGPGGGAAVPRQLHALGLGRLPGQQRLQRPDVPHRDGEQPLGRDRSRRAPRRSAASR